MSGNFAIKGGGVGRLMANAILNFHFDFPHTSLRCQAGAKTWDEEKILIFREYSEPAKLIKVVYKPPRRIETCLVHVY